MFSGKSEELIRLLRRAQVARNRVAAFKPSMDDRYSASEIVSHGQVRVPAGPVSSAAQILARLDPQTQVVGIDEANLFGPALVEVASRLAKRGKRVIVAGLETDFLGRPFAPVPALLRAAHFVTKLLAICARCGAPAEYSQRLAQSKELILVGAVDSYEARGKNCFEPLAPSGHSPERPSAERETSVLH